MRNLLMLLFATVFSSAPIECLGEAATIEGPWIAQIIVSPSQYSSANEAHAREFLFSDFEIKEHSIALPNETSCRLDPPRDEVWQNDMITFGSFGGDWRKIGLEASHPGFEVVTWRINCDDEDERLVQLVWQPNNNLLLLNFGRVFLVLERPS